MIEVSRSCPLLLKAVMARFRVDSDGGATAPRSPDAASVDPGPSGDAADSKPTTIPLIAACAAHFAATPAGLRSEGGLDLIDATMSCALDHLLQASTKQLSAAKRTARDAVALGCVELL